jgi:hypothetical protein
MTRSFYPQSHTKGCEVTRRRTMDGSGQDDIAVISAYSGGCSTFTPGGDCPKGAVSLSPGLRQGYPRREAIAPKGPCPSARGCGLPATPGRHQPCHQPQRGCVRERKPLCRNRYHRFIFIWYSQRKTANHFCGTRKSGKKCTPTWAGSRRNWIVLRLSWVARKIMRISYADWPEPSHRPIG